jgi:PAS domain S-box-containing protein
MRQPFRRSETPRTIGDHVALHSNAVTENEAPTPDPDRAERDKSDKRIGLLIENLRDYAIFEMSLEGTITTWNKGAENITGFRAEDIVGRPVSVLFTREDRSRGEPEREMETAIKYGRSKDDRWHARQNGQVYWGSGALSCIYADGNKPVGFLKIIRDVTAEKQAHDRLRESEQRLRLLVESVKDFALIQINPAGHVVYWNPGAERMFGYMQQEMAGRDYAIVFSREDVERGVPRHDMAQAEEKGRAEYEMTLYRKNGKPFLAHWVSEPVRDDDGRLKGFVKVVRDSTESHWAQEQLRKSQRMEALGRLAGGVAHDFNNLLMVISGYASLLEQKLQDRRDLAASVTHIQETVNRAAQLTGQLLAFSRKQVTRPEVLSVNELIKGIEKMLRTLLGEGIELVLNLQPAAGRVKADAGQIERILVNLAANAHDVMPSGGKLRIETRNKLVKQPMPDVEQSLKPGQFVTITVSDTGPGMDEATRAHIFEPFFTTKQAGRGTGLGLATSYGIAHQSGGTLTVKSEPGRGASFTLYLPRVRAGVRRQIGRSSEPREITGRGTILVVEDEPQLRKLFLESLSAAGYSVLDATDGKDALRIAGEHRGHLDLLITDVVMPHLGGPDLAREIQKHRPGLPVLFVSGYNNRALASQGLLPPSAHLLQKPFRLDALLEAVSDAVKQRSVRSRGAAD